MLYDGQEVDIDSIIAEAEAEPQEVDNESQEVAEEVDNGTETDVVEADVEAPATEAPAVNRIVVDDDTIVSLEDMDLTKAELKELAGYKNNNNKWKQKNEERGKKLNQAEALQQRIETDAEFARWINGYQDARERTLLETYDEDTARNIRRIEQENMELRHKVIVREAQEQYEVEEQELSQNGADIEDIASAYEILNQGNQEYFKAYGKPMPLKEAFAKYLMNGGQTKILQRERTKLQEQIKQERTKVIKSAVPRDLGSSAAVSEKQLPTDADPMKHPVFDLDIFKDIRNT